MQRCIRFSLQARWAIVRKLQRKCFRNSKYEQPYTTLFLRVLKAMSPRIKSRRHAIIIYRLLKSTPLHHPARALMLSGEDALSVRAYCQFGRNSPLENEKWVRKYFLL